MLTRRLCAPGLGLVPLMARAWAEEKAVIFDFSSTALGQLPPGFVTARTGGGANADWRVVEDSPGKRVLAQLAADGTDVRFPLAIAPGISAANLDVSVRFRAVAGVVDRAAGIAVRLTDADNYYVVRANALEDNVNFYRVVKGSRREINGAAAKVASDVWHTLGLKAVDDRFTISFNGAALFEVKDTIFREAGKVALWTKADSVTRFDAFSIQILA